MRVHVFNTSIAGERLSQLLQYQTSLVMRFDSDQPALSSSLNAWSPKAKFGPRVHSGGLGTREGLSSPRASSNEPAIGQVYMVYAPKQISSTWSMDDKDNNNTAYTHKSFVMALMKVDRVGIGGYAAGWRYMARTS